MYYLKLDNMLKPSKFLHYYIPPTACLAYVHVKLKLNNFNTYKLLLLFGIEISF